MSTPRLGATIKPNDRTLLYENAAPYLQRRILVRLGGGGIFFAILLCSALATAAVALTLKRPGQHMEARNAGVANSLVGNSALSLSVNRAPLPVTTEYLSHGSSPQLSPDQEVAALGQQPPVFRDTYQARYREAADLYAFLMETLPEAVAGHAGAQHHVALALEECRAYLGKNGALNHYEITLSFRDSRATYGPFWDSIEDRSLALQEYHRCRNFVGASLTSVEVALGADSPGTIFEYAAVWFERAVRSGYALTTANSALSASPLTHQQRLAMLKSAVSQQEAQAYLVLFEQAWLLEIPEEHRALAVAWLIVACRSGLDCRENAYWFRAHFCVDSSRVHCIPERSAIEHFWASLSHDEQVVAFSTAAEIEHALEAKQLSRLPWPVLPSRGSYLYGNAS